MSDTYYEACLILVAFDREYNYEDTTLIGIARSIEEAAKLQLMDIFRLMEDFGQDECRVVNTRSEYDYPVTIVHTKDDYGNENHWHYYLHHNTKNKRGEGGDTE